jgi:LuxR family quorum-sensing transcriptional regulator LasR
MSDGHQLALIASVIEAVDEADLLKKMQAAAIASGFEYVLHGIELRRPYLSPIQHITSGYPESYQSVYRDKGYIFRDPSVAYCQTHTKPLIWGEGMYSAESHEIMEESSKHGLGHGFSVPVRESAHVVSMLSLARDKPFESAAEMKLVVDAGNVLANCVHVASKKIIVPGIEQSLQPKLSPRERECLKWIAEGKSNGVIADILKISEVTVEFHVHNLFKKLNVVTRLQAAVVGMSMGLIV